MKVKKKKPMTKSIALMIDDKTYKYLKRIMKDLKTKSISETVRMCINNTPEYIPKLGKIKNGY